MKIYVIILFLNLVSLFFVFPFSVHADPGESRFFNQPDILRARYIEEKYIPGISNPIRSEGDFVYIKEYGLAWFMEAPFEMKTVVTPEGFSQWIDGEKQDQPESMRRAMRPVLDNIAAIFSSDVEIISAYFDVSFTGEGGDVRHIVLHPKSDQLKPFLQRIEVSGDRYIETVKIVFADGKYNIVKYGPVETSAQSISAEERAFFEK